MGCFFWCGCSFLALSGVGAGGACPAPGPALSFSHRLYSPNVSEFGGLHRLSVAPGPCPPGSPLLSPSGVVAFSTPRRCAQRVPRAPRSFVAGRTGHTLGTTPGEIGWDIVLSPSGNNTRARVAQTTHPCAKGALPPPTTLNLRHEFATSSLCEGIEKAARKNPPRCSFALHPDHQETSLILMIWMGANDSAGR